MPPGALWSSYAVVPWTLCFGSVLADAHSPAGASALRPRSQCRYRRGRRDVVTETAHTGTSFRSFEPYDLARLLEIGDTSTKVRNDHHEY